MNARMRSALITLVTAVGLLGGTGVGAAASWHVVCDTTSKLVVVTENVDEGVHRVMKGPLPSRRTAEIWLGESCPGGRCDEAGQCSQTPPATNDWVAGEVNSETVGTPAGGSATGGGWVAGEVNSVTLSAPAGGSAPPAHPAGPAGPAGPGAAGLGPLMDNARAAVGACNFHAALLTADHMLNFDPEHPWLVANHQRLRDLALRQRATEDAVWQASSALSSGDLKRARKLAGAAADTAVSCQSRAVSELLHGIDDAIEHKRQLRAADNRAAMAALLPGLVELANAAIATKYGTTPAPAGSSSYGGAAASTRSGSAPLVSAPDPCAFKYEYRNVWNTEPVCTCPGYRFDGKQHRCVK